MTYIIDNLSLELAPQLHIWLKQYAPSANLRYMEDDEENNTSSIAKEEILTGLCSALKEVRLHQTGKIQLKTAEAWLNEI